MGPIISYPVVGKRGKKEGTREKSLFTHYFNCYYETLIYFKFIDFNNRKLRITQDININFKRTDFDTNALWIVINTLDHFGIRFEMLRNLILKTLLGATIRL